MNRLAMLLILWSTVAYGPPLSKNDYALPPLDTRAFADQQIARENRESNEKIAFVIAGVVLVVGVAIALGVYYGLKGRRESNKPITP